MQLERQDRQYESEKERLNNETISLRQRLDRAESDLLQARREQLRLNEHITSLEKEVKLENKFSKSARQTFFMIYCIIAGHK